MDKPNWLPKNPYEGEIDIWQNIRLATKQGWDEGSLETTRVVLDYLLTKQIWNHSYGQTIPPAIIRLMLLELGDK